VAQYEFPTSFGQRRMWLLAEMDPGEPTYNITWALRLDGGLDVSALQQAWDAALDRHETLRTTFRNESGVPVQVIEDEPVTAPLLVTSVEERAPGERERAARSQIAQLSSAPFDLAAGPLVRAGLVRLAPDTHVLAVVMHHIVADGWSFRILFDELSADYEAISRGSGPVGTEPPIQYADFAIWQLEHAEDGGYAPAERFWRAELAGVPASLPLPADRPYPARQTFAAASIDTALDAGLANDLRELATQHGTTLFAVLLAGYAVVLSRLTGRDDLLVAVPMAARIRPETETVVGLFMNTVPVRIRIDRDATLSDLVRAVHATAARALAHQELPFARVVELIRPDRDPTRLPLAQVMFALEEPWTVPDRGGLHWRPELIENGTAKFELELTITDAPTGPQVRVNYNTALFEAATAERLARSVHAVLADLVARPGARVGELTAADERETAELARWNATATPPADGDGVTLRDRFERQVKRTPDAVAVTGEQGSLSYAQLDAAAGRVAHRLAAEGVDSESVVAVLAERSPELVVALLGVIKAGAAYLPLDPEYPAERLAFMLADSAAQVVLTQRHLGGVLPEASPAGLYLDDAAGWPAEAGGGDRAAVSPDSAAYLIYTSGSTGRPKGVISTHRGLLNRLDWMRAGLPFSGADVVLQKTPASFDVSVWEFFLPLTTGATLALARPGGHRDPAYLREAIESYGVSVIHFVPSMLNAFLADEGEADDGARAASCATVRHIVCSGEELPAALARRCLAALPGASLHNYYGPTEASVDVTAWQATPGALAGRARVPIGGPVSNVTMHVLDPDLRQVPVGVTGELHIGGVQVARGYHRRPGLTAQRFRPDPFGPAGSRMYATGDHGRWRPDGTIEYLGRIDGQVKLRGIRIELGEIEAALRAQPGVRDAAVTVSEVSPGDLRLVGYVAGAEVPDADSLRTALRASLPEYMVPAAVVPLGALPLTASGKTDHRALPEPDWGVTAGQVPVAPRTPTESRLAVILAELLTLPAPAGVSDNFFALGGHSLTATRLMARIRADFGVDLPIRALFSDPTVAGLATALAAAGGGADEPAGPARAPRAGPAGDGPRTLVSGDRR
jgi:amino acid adenylation domain-containing protein